MEYVSNYRITQALANRYAQNGYLCLRPDLRAHGDALSAVGIEDLADAWISDVCALIDHTLQLTPGLPVNLVGMRLGAAIIQHVPRDVAHRYYLDPVSGRSFLRQQRILRKLIVAASSEPRVHELVGLTLTPLQSQTIALLNFSAPAGATPTDIREHLMRGFSCGQTSEIAPIPLTAVESLTAHPSKEHTKPVHWPRVPTSYITIGDHQGGCPEFRGTLGGGPVSIRLR